MLRRWINFRIICPIHFSINLLQGAKVTASETRGKLGQYAPSKVLDNDKNSYWAVNDNNTTASLTFQLKAPATFNCMEIKEFIRLGQRISSFTIEIEKGGKWEQVFKGSTVGHKKLAKFADTSASQVRVTFKNALSCPVIESVKLYKVL